MTPRQFGAVGIRITAQDGALDFWRLLEGPLRHALVAGADTGLEPERVEFAPPAVAIDTPVPGAIESANPTA